jgi:phthalate 4,5-dioxygenase
MLSKHDNELLTRTERGTPMGELMRRYWIPALLSEEIPAPDCPPVQVRILGEQLVAFRDSKGQIGLLEENCSHRGTSLYYGRNEECGLRCIYHGWKYDVDGNVLDTPAEPPGSKLKDKVKHLAYPTREAAGIVYAYLGPPEKMPLFPNYDWHQVPLSYTYVTKRFMECNYLQGVEGEVDSSHLSLLHRSFKPTPRQALFAEDSSPIFEIEEKDFGLVLTALRKTEGTKQYVRISTFVLPMVTCIPSGPREGERLQGYEIKIYVPTDDFHSWRYDVGFAKSSEVNNENVGSFLPFRRKQMGPDYKGVRNIHNHYLQDRQAQKTDNYTGIQGFVNHDACATESMGPLYDRSREHLGLSDKGVIAMRRFLLDVLRDFQAGKEPPHIVRDPAENSFPDIFAGTAIIPAGIDWRDALDEARPAGS